MFYPLFAQCALPICTSVWLSLLMVHSSRALLQQPYNRPNRPATVYNIKCKWWKANKLSNKWTGNNRKNVARLVYCFEWRKRSRRDTIQNDHVQQNTTATCHTKYIRFRFWHISYSIRFDFDTVAVVATVAAVPPPPSLSSIVDVAIAECQCCWLG